MKKSFFWLSPVFLGIVLPNSALAYIGPGAGLTAIGTVVAVIGAIFLMVVGFIWYPVKRVLRGRKRTKIAGKQPPGLKR